MDKVDWYSLTFNPNAIHILEKNLDKVYWYWLSLNPNALHLLFEYNYEKMLIQNQTFANKITEYVFNPMRLNRIAISFGMEMDEYSELL